MLDAASHAASLAIAALVLLLGLMAWQNRDLPARLRATGRRPAEVLGEALRLWSPLAVAIVLAVLLAHALSAAALALVHRATPLDAWCRLRDADTTTLVPCTGLPRTLPVASLQGLPQREAVARLVLERYAGALDRLPVAGAAVDARTLSPPAVLGLPLGPQDDPELRRMRAELQALVDTPAPPPRSPLDVLRARGDAEIRTRRLRELTRQVVERREALAASAYGGLPREEQARRWLRHRLAHALLAAQWPADALRHLDAGADPQILLRTRLVADAAASLEVLAREDANRLSRAALGLALPTPAWCRLAADGPAFACPRDGHRGALVLEALPATDALRLSLDAWREDARREGLRRLGVAALAARRGATSASQQVDALPAELRMLAFPSSARCSLGAPAGCADRLLGAMLERTLAPGARWGAGEVRRADAALEVRIGAVGEALWRDIERVHADALALGEDWLRLHARMRWIGWLLLAFLAAKSFLYVLALAAFRQGAAPAFGLEGPDTPQGELHVGRRLTLDPGFEGALLTHRQLSNSDNQLRFAPWPGSAPIARLLRGRYLWFTRGRFLAAERKAGGELGRIASADAGQAIVEWRMRPGEEVVFGWRDFFGASENLRFRTRLSLRLSSLLLGRVLFRIARAPADAAGVLLLRADVEQVATERLHAVPPERLLAWNRQARFRAHGAESAWGVLVHGVTLVRDASAGGLVVAGSEDRGPRFGSLRFLRRIFGAIF